MRSKHVKSILIIVIVLLIPNNSYGISVKVDSFEYMRQRDVKAENIFLSAFELIKVQAIDSGYKNPSYSKASSRKWIIETNCPLESLLRILTHSDYFELRKANKGKIVFEVKENTWFGLQVRSVSHITHEELESLLSLTFLGGDCNINYPTEYAEITTEDIIELIHGIKSGHTRGILVKDIAINGPAEYAGLVIGDIITSVFDNYGETPIKSVADFENKIKTQKIGNLIWLRINHGGCKRSIPLRVGIRPYGLPNWTSVSDRWY